jgi:hypothetical protein
MCAGADSIDDVEVLRSGRMKTLFDRVYAPSTSGTLLREFSFGHVRRLEAVLSTHLSRLCQRVDLLPGADVRAFVDIDCGSAPPLPPRGEGDRWWQAAGVRPEPLPTAARRGMHDQPLETAPRGRHPV